MFSNAIINPSAMMVILRYADVASLTMIASFRFFSFTLKAHFHISNIEKKSLIALRLRA